MMRLKQSLMCLCFLLAITHLSGQINHTDYGFDVGAGRAFLSGTAIDQNLDKGKLGFMGGFFYQVNAPKILSLRAAIAYEMKGSAATLTLTNQYGEPIGTLKLRQNLSYITVPLLLRVSFGKTFRFFMNAGPYVGYLISQPKATALYNQYDYKRLDYGVSGGLGCLAPLGKKFALGFEIRHNMGLCDIAPVSRYGTNGTIKTNSTNLILSFTRKFGFRQ